MMNFYWGPNALVDVEDDLLGDHFGAQLYCNDFLDDDFDDYYDYESLADDYYSSDEDSVSGIDYYQKNQYWKTKMERLDRFIQEDLISMKAKRYARKRQHAKRPKSIGDLVLCYLNEDRCSEAKYCDITIKSDLKRFPAHKCVLSAVSDYFSKMFCVEMKEKYEKVIELKEVSSDVIERLLDIIYSNDIDPIITIEDVYDFLPIARYMQIEFLILSCGKHFVKNLTADNALSNWSYARTHDFKIDEVEEFISEHIGCIVERIDFLHLDKDELESILKMKLCAEQKYSMLMKWIKQDELQKKEHLKTLFQHINLREAPKKFLFDVVCQEPLMMSSPEYFELTAKAMSNRDRPIAYHGYRNDRIDRLASHSKSVVFLYVVCQQYLRARKYELETKVWTDLPQLNTIGENFGAVYDGVNLIVIGGKAKTGNKSISSVYCLDLSLETPQPWTQMPPLNLPRRSMGCAVLGTCLYVIGGFASKNCLSHTETLTYPVDDTWLSVGRSMKTSRRDLALVTCGEYIYAIGGSMVENGRSCNRNESVDSHCLWTTKSPMIEHRGKGFAGVALNGKIYIMGSDVIQWNYKSSGASAECYDPKKNSWHKIARLKSLQFVHSAAVVNGKLVAYGFSVRRKTPLLEEYDPFKNEWVVLQQFGDEMKDAKMIAV